MLVQKLVLCTIMSHLLQLCYHCESVLKCAGSPTARQQGQVDSHVQSQRAMRRECRRVMQGGTAHTWRAKELEGCPGKRAMDLEGCFWPNEQ